MKVGGGGDLRGRRKNDIGLRPKGRSCDEGDIGKVHLLQRRGGREYGDSDSDPIPEETMESRRTPGIR